MSKSVIKEESLKRISHIHELSKLYNQKLGQSHKDKLLALMGKHIEEIEELSGRNDNHYLTETGDLIILCLELLLENKISIDKTLLQCFKRYEEKLSGLLKEK